MAEQLDKKLREYTKKTLKQGYSKEQIRASLQRVGYDTGIINKSFKVVSGKRTATNILLALVIVVLVIGLFLFWNYYIKPKPLVFLAQEPKEKFAQTNKSILLMSWDLPSKAQQNELINLTTVWKSQTEVTKDFGTVLSLYDKNGNEAQKYFFGTNRYPTSSREQGDQYMETYSFNAPYLKPGTFYYKIGLWDMVEQRIFYSYDGTVLGNLTIKETLNIMPCGLTILSVNPASPAEKAGVKVGDVIVGINGKRLEFEKVPLDTELFNNALKKTIINLKEFDLNTENSTYKIVKKAGESSGVRWRYKFCNII